MVNVTDLNPVFFMKDNRTNHDEKKIEKILDTEDVTAIFHDLQEPICFSVT